MYDYYIDYLLTCERNKYKSNNDLETWKTIKSIYRKLLMDLFNEFDMSSVTDTLDGDDDYQEWLEEEQRKEYDY